MSPGASLLRWKPGTSSVSTVCEEAGNAESRSHPRHTAAKVIPPGGLCPLKV